MRSVTFAWFIRNLSKMFIQSGVLPIVLTALCHHSDLARRTHEAELTSSSLQYLRKCKDKYLELSHLIQEHHLPNAVVIAAELQRLLDSCPSPLNKSKVLLDLQVGIYAFSLNALLIIPIESGPAQCE